VKKGTGSITVDNNAWGDEDEIDIDEGMGNEVENGDDMID
jgi:hypothetical protein